MPRNTVENIETKGGKGKFVDVSFFFLLLPPLRGTVGEKAEAGERERERERETTEKAIKTTRDLRKRRKGGP